MAKSKTKQRQSAVGRAFKRAWKLLGRLERRLQLARIEEEKRTRQLGAAVGKKAAKRSTQLGVAQAEVAQVEGLLTELSELIAANARAQAEQVVKDVAHEAAGAVRDAAATEPVEPKPVRKPPVAKLTGKPAAASMATGTKPRAKPAAKPRAKPAAKRSAKPTTATSTPRRRVRKAAVSIHPPTGPEPTAGA
jgi:septal ring-binding cell division protein DamX